MRNCTDCKYAKWKKNAIGNLHPSGDGYCSYTYKIPPLPASMEWFGNTPPVILGGAINRRELLKEHCTYYELKRGD